MPLYQSPTLTQELTITTTTTTSEDGSEKKEYQVATVKNNESLTSAIEIDSAREINPDIIVSQFKGISSIATSSIDDMKDRIKALTNTETPPAQRVLERDLLRTTVFIADVNITDKAKEASDFIKAEKKTSETTVDPEDTRTGIILQSLALTPERGIAVSVLSQAASAGPKCFIDANFNLEGNTSQDTRFTTVNSTTFTKINEHNFKSENIFMLYALEDHSKHTGAQLIFYTPEGSQFSVLAQNLTNNPQADSNGKKTNSLIYFDQELDNAPYIIIQTSETKTTNVYIKPIATLTTQSTVSINKEPSEEKATPSSVVHNVTVTKSFTLTPHIADLRYTGAEYRWQTCEGLTSSKIKKHLLSLVQRRSTSPVAKPGKIATFVSSFLNKLKSKRVDHEISGIRRSSTPPHHLDPT